MLNYLCPSCSKQLRITNGDYIFSYNIKCSNSHNYENISSEDLLTKKSYNIDSLYKCKNHKKPNIIHCFQCDEDLCFKCLKDYHNNHKFEYLKSFHLDDSEKYNLILKLNKEKKNLSTINSELLNFKNKFNLYLDIIISELNKCYQIRNDLINNISQKDISYIDYQNYKILFEDKSFNLIKENTKKFIKNETFIKKFDSLRNIFELLIKKGKYIEEKKINDKFNKIKNMIPLNKGLFITLNFESYIDHYIISHFYIKIMKINSNIFSTELKYDIIFEKNINIYGEIVLKQNNDIKKELSFYIAEISEEILIIYKVTIKNLFDKKEINHNNNDNFILEKVIELNIFECKGVISLSENKNLIFNENKIFLYDESFNFNKIIFTDENNIGLYDYLKINQELIIFSNNWGSIYIFKIDEDLIDKKKLINAGLKILYFSDKKKILFIVNKNKIYLINFNIAFPEIMQTVQINSSFEYCFNDTNILKNLYFFNDENIFIEFEEKIFKNSSYFNMKYLIQYKIIDNELTEISRNILKNENNYKYKFNK